jgi:hypothetical protein
MKTYDDILHIIRDELGLKDIAAYKAYCDTFMDTHTYRVPTPVERSLLDPDTIDNRAFWEVAELLFKTDPVSNCGFDKPRSIREARRCNISIYQWDGFITALEHIQYDKPRASILEIGPGYGTLRQWIDVKTRFSYHGIDVYPKIEDIDEAERTGLMGPVTKSRLYDAVVSCNVFQHLSISQRRAYYRDAHATLVSDGWFMVSMFHDDSVPNHPSRDEEGRLWMRHYGQFTEIQKRDAIAEDLSVYYDIKLELIRDDHWIAFLCRKKAISPVSS